MFIANIRITHRRVPTKIRERYAFSRDVQKRILGNLARNGNIAESVILVTCNRTELYLVGADLGQTIDTGLGALETESEEKNTGKYTEITTCMDAINHLFEVASGLDSMIIGETQILGQVREAHLLAKQAGTTGMVLDTTFDKAVRVGKMVRQKTGISKGRVSIGTAAVELAGENIDIENNKIVLVGSGKMGSLVAKSLVDGNARNVYIANRTYENAVKLASHLECNVIPFNELYDHLKDADLLITATNSPHTIINPGTIKPDRKKPLCIIDVSVPRNVDPGVGNLENVNLYHMDLLEDIAEKNRQLRVKEAKGARALIKTEVENTKNALSRLHMESRIGLMRKDVESIRQRELIKAVAILSNSPETKELASNENVIRVMDDLTRAMANKILHKPIREIRGNSGMDDVGLMKICS